MSSDAAPPVEVQRLAAFTADPEGGNPAGVVITEQALDPAHMQRLAAEVGFSETAFLVPAGDREWRVRYFAPAAEVPFCGHATIAAGVHLGRTVGPGPAAFHTPAGLVQVDIGGGTPPTATLTSVRPQVEVPDAALVDATLATMGWDRTVLDPDLPPALADAGARHLLLALRSRDLLAALRYDFDALLARCRQARLVTVALLWRERAQRWHARNAFPVGGVVEDPATGAAAAALGGWLRATGVVRAPVSIEILQGADMGRPSQLTVFIPDGHDGIAVTGTAVDLPR